MSFAVTLHSIECKSPSLARSKFECHHLIDIVSSSHHIHYNSNFDKLYFAKMKQLLTCNNFLFFFLGNLCGQETKAPAVKGQPHKN